MNRLKWWMRIYGAFYLLLALMNLAALLFDPQLGMYKDLLPAPMTGNALAARGFADAWMAFAMDVLGTGTFFLWASRNPVKYVGAVWFAVWLEFLHGVIDDLFLIARGYDAASYAGFIVVHLIIIVTGIMFARQASALATSQA